MKYLIVKTAALSFLTLSAGMVSATPVKKFGNTETRLECSTYNTCGNISVVHPVRVLQEGDEMRLYWHHNEPANISAGPNKAHTIGASCPANSAVSNLTAVWTLADSGRPLSVISTHCDGYTQSEFLVTIEGDRICHNPTDPFYNHPDPENGTGSCVYIPWGLN